MMIRQLAPTFITCSVVTFLLTAKYAGGMIFFPAVILIPWLLHSSWVAIRNPSLRSLILARIGIWVLGVMVVLGAHVYMNLEARREGQRIVAKIEAYMARHGSCPATLAEVGVDKDEVKKVLGINAYICEAGKPMFFYGTTYMPFETEYYDFTQHRWSHVYD